MEKEILKMDVRTAARPHRIARREWRFVLVFGALLMLLTSLPYILAFSMQGEMTRFSGFVFGVEDGNSYIAKMLSGWAGEWLFKSPFTAYPQNGLLFYLPYLLLGKLASPPALHDQLVVLYHLLRISGGMLVVFAAYAFLAYFIQTPNLRRLGLVLVAAGGGLGWILVLSGRPEWLGSLPLDYISPEAFGFLGLYGVAHLPVARALLLWTLLAYLELSDFFSDRFHSETPDHKNFWMKTIKLSALWLSSGFFNPLSPVITGLVIAVHIGGVFLWDAARSGLKAVFQDVRWRRLIYALITAGLLPGLFVAYNLAVSVLDPYASIWASQNQIYSPHFAHYLLAYGLLIPYCWIGGRSLLRQDFRRGWFLVGWVLAMPLWVYAPIELQRRLTEGVWVAICALGMAALEQPARDSVTLRFKGWQFFFLPLVLLFPSTLILLAGGFQAALSPAPSLFLPVDQARVIGTLQSNPLPAAAVIASYESANPMPAWVPLRVLVGHGPESIHKDILLPQIEAFFRPETPDADRLALIKKFDVQYVFWGPAERALGAWQPAEADYLELIERQGDFSLFRVVGKPP